MDSYVDGCAAEIPSPRRRIPSAHGGFSGRCSWRPLETVRTTVCPGTSSLWWKVARSAIRVRRGAPRMGRFSAVEIPRSLTGRLAAGIRSGGPGRRETIRSACGAGRATDPERHFCSAVRSPMLRGRRSRWVIGRDADSGRTGARIGQRRGLIKRARVARHGMQCGGRIYRAIGSRGDCRQTIKRCRERFHRISGSCGCRARSR
jgi:hypothetical protein